MKKTLSLLLALFLILPFSPAPAASDPDPLLPFAIHHGPRDEKKVAITVDDFFDLDGLFFFSEPESEEEISWEVIPSVSPDIPEDEVLDDMDAEIQDVAPEWVLDNEAGGK